MEGSIGKRAMKSFLYEIILVVELGKRGTGAHRGQRDSFLQTIQAHHSLERANKVNLHLQVVSEAGLLLLALFRLLIYHCVEKLIVFKCACTI